MSDLISIIMPAYNAKNYIKQAVDSVLSQSYTNWELIIINDGSTDGTIDIIKDYHHQDRRIKYHSQENKGQGAARNFGITQAKSNIVAFLDSDDTWLPQKLEVQLYHFTKEKIALLFCGAYIINEKNEIIGEFKVPNGKKYYDYKSIPELIRSNPVTTLTVMADKNILKQLGGFSSNKNILVGEDYYLWLKVILNNFRIMSISNKLALYRRHFTQSTKNQFINKLSEINLMEILADEYPEHTQLFKEKVLFLIKESLNHVGDHNQLNEFKKVCKKYLSKNKYVFLSIALRTMSFKLFKRYYLYIHSRIFK